MEVRRDADMSVTSFYFFCMFAVSLGVYYTVPRKFQWCTLALFSVGFFVASSDWRTGVYLLVNIAVTFLVTTQIVKAKERNKDENAKGYMLIGLAVNLSMLATLKYSNFFVYNWNVFMNVLKTGHSLTELRLLAPIGISYYTFISVGYILDVYWGITEAEKIHLKWGCLLAIIPR